MMDFIFANAGTLLVGLIVAVIVSLIVIALVKNKKKGRTSCGCGCKNCPSSEICHKK